MVGIRMSQLGQKIVHLPCSVNGLILSFIQWWRIFVTTTLQTMNTHNKGNVSFAALTRMLRLRLRIAHARRYMLFGLSTAIVQSRVSIPEPIIQRS